MAFSNDIILINYDSLIIKEDTISYHGIIVEVDKELVFIDTNVTSIMISIENNFIVEQGDSTVEEFGPTYGRSLFLEGQVSIIDITNSIDFPKVSITITKYRELCLFDLLLRCRLDYYSNGDIVKTSEKKLPTIRVYNSNK